MTEIAWRCRASVAAFVVLLALLLFAPGEAAAAGCAFAAQGEARVAAVIDGRTFRLEDGREIRLAGIEPASAEKARGVAALSAIIGGRDVTLQGEDDAPDRYGRQAAFVFPAGSEHRRKPSCCAAARRCSRPMCPTRTAPGRLPPPRAPPVRPNQASGPVPRP